MQPREQFLANTLIQDAVLRNIIILGEATKNLLEAIPDLQEKYSHIPWLDIYGMRNRITHGYFFINQDLNWIVVEGEMPLLMEQLKQLRSSI